MQKAEHELTPEPPYYTLDTALFTGQFHYFDRGNDPVEVRGKAHRSEERYQIEKGVEQDIRPIPTLTGTRTSKTHYFHFSPSR